MTKELRKSVLEPRHLALGANMGDWNGMDVAWSYAADTNDEHTAVREAAGLFDVSALKKVFVSGPDALAIVMWANPDFHQGRALVFSQQSCLPT